jgi:hypothetical protein
MTDCVTEMEDTRKEMFKVAKVILKFKDGVINGKPASLVIPGGNAPNNQRRGSNASNNSSP